MKNIIQLFEAKVKDARNFDQMIGFLSWIPYLPEHRYFHLQYLYFNGNIYEYFIELCNYKRNLKLLNTDIAGFRFEFTKNSSSYSCAFFIKETQVENLFSINSITYPFIWNTLIERIVRRRYPDLVLLYWKQSELRDALFLIEQRLIRKYDLVVKELSIKEKRESKWEREYYPVYDSDRKWTSKSLKQVFDEATERRQWFKKVKFQFFSKDDETKIAPIANCTITKYGHIFFNNLFQDITSNLLPDLEGYHRKRIHLFQNKGLKERNYEPSVPLSIEYDIDIFKDKENLSTFLTIIRKYPNSTKAVFHTNPYFHASVADYKDGSSFDIWVLSLNRILIIPQIKTSVEGLERLVSYIFDKFEEGQIKEYQLDE